MLHVSCVPWYAITCYFKILFASLYVHIDIFIYIIYLDIIFIFIIIFITLSVCAKRLELCSLDELLVEAMRHSIKLYLGPKEGKMRALSLKTHLELGNVFHIL